MIYLLRIVVAGLLLAELVAPESPLLKEQPVNGDLEQCDVVLLDIDSRADWTTNCDLITIPAPAPGEPDRRQICDPTFLIIRDPTCGPPETESNFTLLPNAGACLGDRLSCTTVGFRNVQMKATLAGRYRITNVGASAGELVFNLAGCTKIYRRSDLFHPLCGLDEGGARIGLTLPPPSDNNPLPTVEGAFDTLAVECSLDGAEAAALFADACADPANFCFDALSDGFIEITLSTGNLIAESQVTGSAQLGVSFASFDFDVLTDQIQANCRSCVGNNSPIGVVPVSFVLPDDGDDNVTADFENPANYRIVIDDRNDGNSGWDQSIVPTGNGTYTFTGLRDGDYTVAIIYVPLAGDRQSDAPEACGFCVRNVTVDLIPEPVIEAVITDDCLPADGAPDAPAAGNGAIELTVTEGKNVGFQWDNGATTSRIDNLEAGRYCVTITYGPQVSEQDLTGRCSECRCFDVGSFQLTCTISGDNATCGGAPVTLTANPAGGSGNYRYQWSSGETTPSITVSPTTTTRYEVTVTDAVFNGDCSVVCSKEVGVFNPSCVIEGDEEVWLGAAATLTARLPDSEGDFRYQWSTGDNASIITVYPTEPTTYSVTVTAIDGAGNSGCSFVCSKTVWVTEPVCAIEGVSVLCPGQSTELTAVPPVKEKNYHYAWSTGSQEPWVTVAPTASTTYSVTITAIPEAGEIPYSFVCEHDIQIIEPVCTIEGESAICKGTSTTLTAKAGGGAGAYHYRWSNGESGSSIQVSPSSTTTYTVTVTDGGSECAVTADFTVTVNDLSSSISGDGRICRGESTLLTAQPVGGSGSYRYRWNTGATTPAITVSPEQDKTYRLTVTDLDASGRPVCPAVSTFAVTVSQPTCTIIDQADVACGKMGALTFTVQGGFPAYTYEVTTPAATVATGTLAQNGAVETIDRLMPGEYTVRITDAEGCTTSSSTVIAELSGSGDFTGCLACNNEINVTLGEHCSVAITLDMVAEGHLQDCGQAESLRRALEVVVYDEVYPLVGGQPRPDQVVNQCGTFNYSIQLKKAYEDCFSWTPCWGRINAKDPSPVVEILPAKVQGIFRYTDQKGETQFTPYDCTADEFARFFEDPNGFEADDCGRFEFHYLVCDDIDSIYRQVRSYTDPAYPYFTGRPQPQNDCCGELELIGVEDRLDNVPCEDRSGQITARIKRTFTYRNRQGAVSTAVQDICFYRPEIHLPDCELHVDICTVNALGGGAALLAPGQLPALVQKGEEPLPFYYNGLGEKLGLTGHACDLSVSYTDQEFPAACGKKIIRTWTVLDWCWTPKENRSRYVLPVRDACYGELYHSESQNYAYAGKQTLTFEQHILLEATEALSIECKDLRVSTGPFNCTAVVAPPLPLVNDCVAADFEFEVWGYIPDSKTGEKKYVQIGRSQDGRLAGVPAGSYDLYYQVTDACGRVYNGVWKNSAGRWEFDRAGACTLTVVDDIDPVAVCDNNLHVSIGGVGVLAEGISRVTAADVDEGSWDNCGPVELHVRRSIEKSSLEIYAERVHHLSWPGDYVARFENGNVIYLAARDVPYWNIRRNDPLIIQEPGGRFYSFWSNAVFFTCNDISTGSNDQLKLELRATDRAGNTNSCRQMIHIEDKLPPTCEVHDAEILCTDIDFNAADAVANPSLLHARFGKPEEVVKVLDNCGADISEVVTWKPGNCGTGLIERTYTVTDASGLSTVCTQRIRILKVNDYAIQLPGDVTSAECGVEPVPDLTVSTGACEVLAVNRDTVRFEAGGDSDYCYKLLITYRVINWCEYDGKTLQPTVIARDIDNDTDLEESTWLEARFETNAFLTGNYKLYSGNWPAEGAFVVKMYAADAKRKRKALPEKILVRATCPDGATQVGYLSYRYDESSTCYRIEESRNAGSLCQNLPYADQVWTPGFYEYTQIVKVYDRTAPTITATTERPVFCAYGSPSTNCDGPVTITFTTHDECTPDLVTVQSVRLDQNNRGRPEDGTGRLYTVTKGNGHAYTIAGNLPVGRHTFVINATDGCGNVGGLRIPFEVVDCRPPAPICIQTLSVDLMPVDADSNGTIDGGSNTVWATDFIASPIDDCSPFDIPSRVKYFVFKAGELPNGPQGVTLADLTEAHTSVTFTCAEESQTVLTYVYALDAAGNFDYCMVMTRVKAGSSPNPCSADGNLNDGQIAGLITDEGRHAVAGVNVRLSGQANMTYLTDEKGDYAFQGLRQGNDYTISPSLNREVLNGVSTLDLVLISKHILGVKRLDSPYKLIAADANNSKSITTLDLITLRKLILNLESEFKNNASWRFIRADHVFPQPDNPWSAPLPEVANFNNLDGQATCGFVAVKIGDVNGSARVNNQTQTDARSVAGAFALQVEDRALEAGNEYAIPVTARQLETIQGFQGTLTFDRSKVELMRIDYGLTREENFGVFAADGLVTMSWNANSEQRTANGDLFSLVLRTTTDTRLSEVLGIGSQFTQAEAYNTADQTMDLTLTFEQAATAAGDIELYQNAPNPFREETLIRFSLPEAATGAIVVSDMNGRTLEVIQGNFEEGYNEISLRNADFPSGVLYYTLKTEQYNFTRKMIHLG